MPLTESVLDVSSLVCRARTVSIIAKEGTLYVHQVVTASMPLRRNAQELIDAAIKTTIEGRSMVTM